MTALKVIPVTSFIDSSFFTSLADLKLNEFKLDSSERPISGKLTDPTKLNKFTSVPILTLDYSSFGNGAAPLSVAGVLHNVNTIEEFKKVDKRAFIERAGQTIMQAVAQNELTNLFQFHILTFSDLKKYKFYYWVAYPTVNVDIEVEEASFDEKLELDVAPLSGKFLAYVKKTPVALNEFAASGQSAETAEFVFIDSTLDKNSVSSEIMNYLYAVHQLGHRKIILHAVKKDLVVTRRLKLSCSSPKITGWERTAQGKLGPKLANLGSLIDPHQLAEQAVDLNLKLMKWRIAPKLDLDVIRKQRVLLLGAGTLGSYVSRVLMGWGVRDITFVDSSSVSYSNPVRQPLFNFEDCFSNNGQGAIKAVRAAEALKQIFPGCNSHGIQMEVPMVGHSVVDEKKMHADYERLCELFDSHDVVYLLMDSRESRWLPTVLGLAKGKLVLNAALGFDSYLVMRHGLIDNRNPNAERLGCYYCNDVVAPNDSLTDRTLDQMCTVTRPGAALMASSLAVELMASVLQNASPDVAHLAKSNLGEAPHQIRGFINTFSQMKLSTPNYPYCSACSTSVIDGCKNEGWPFIKKCLEDTKFLEQVCGLTEVQEQAEKASEELLQALELDDDDEWEM